MTKLDFRHKETEYQICFQALMLSERKPAVIEWDSYVDLLRSIKGIGNESKIQLGGVNLYDLKSLLGEHMILNLSKQETRIILESIEQTSWRPAVLEDVVRTRNWLKTCLEEPDAIPVN